MKKEASQILSVAEGYGVAGWECMTAGHWAGSNGGLVRMEGRKGKGEGRGRERRKESESEMHYINICNAPFNF